MPFPFVGAVAGVRVNELPADGRRSGVLKAPRLCSDEVAARFVAGGAGDFGDGNDAHPKRAGVLLLTLPPGELISIGEEGGRLGAPGFLRTRLRTSSSSGSGRSSRRIGGGRLVRLLFGGESSTRV